jgi:hypothetical protein
MPAATLERFKATGVELFRAAPQVDSNGRKREWTTAELNEIYSYNSIVGNLHDAPILNPTFRTSNWHKGNNPVLNTASSTVGQRNRKTEESIGDRLKLFDNRLPIPRGFPVLNQHGVSQSLLVTIV